MPKQLFRNITKWLFKLPKQLFRNITLAARVTAANITAASVTAAGVTAANITAASAKRQGVAINFFEALQLIFQG